MPESVPQPVCYVSCLGQAIELDVSLGGNQRGTLFDGLILQESFDQDRHASRSMSPRHTVDQDRLAALVRASK